MSLIIELNASTNMFYFLKHLLLLNLVIFKLKCNSFTLNEILSLYASPMCLRHSCFIENHPIWILEDRPLISELVLSHNIDMTGPSEMEGSRCNVIMRKNMHMCKLKYYHQLIPFILCYDN
jgi:hypothetical protein